MQRSRGAVKDQEAGQQDHRSHKAENAVELTTHECIQSPRLVISDSACILSLIFKDVVVM
jgi:hypothetical protein